MKNSQSKESRDIKETYRDAIEKMINNINSLEHLEDVYNEVYRRYVND